MWSTDVAGTATARRGARFVTVTSQRGGGAGPVHVGDDEVHPPGHARADEAATASDGFA